MAKRTCEVDGCEGKHVARGMCHPHYRKWYRQTHGRNRQSEYHDRTCIVCGEQFRAARRDGKICSDACRSELYLKRRVKPKQTRCALPLDHPVRQIIRKDAEKWQQRSPLRIAYEAGDRQGLISAVRELTRQAGDCWLWTRRLNDGYPTVRIAGKTKQVHRLVLEAKHGAPLGKQAAHHICATAACVNPEHLQPVTARENTAEMLARTYMLQRIADLEAALSNLNPTHPLLHEIGVLAAS